MIAYCNCDPIGEDIFYRIQSGPHSVAFLAENVFSPREQGKDSRSQGVFQGIRSWLYYSRMLVGELYFTMIFARNGTSTFIG